MFRSEKKNISSEKNPYQVKKTHIKPYHTFYCWPIVSLLLKNGRPCVECPSHDVSPLLAGPWRHDLFQDAWPIQDGGSSVGSPASPRRGVIKVVMHGNFTSFPTAEDSGWGDEQAKLLSRHLRIHMLLQMLFNVWQSAHTRATHG